MSPTPVLLRAAAVSMLAATLFPAPSRAQVPSFQYLGEFHPAGVSDDGNVVAGGGAGGVVRWTAGGLEVIGELPDAEYTFADAISGDGNTIVGNDYNSNVVRWTRSAGLHRLVLGYPSDVSHDGSVIVGSVPGVGSFRWTQAAGPVDISADLPTGYRFAFASDVSADGNAIAGTAAAGPGQGGGFHIVRWTPAGAVDLGDLPGGEDHGQATGISADGSTVIGIGRTASGWEAVRWRSETGLQPLGRLPGDGPMPPILNHVGPTAVSGDGSIVLGTDYPGPGVEGVAFIWDETRGIRALKDALEDDYGLDLTGWRLTGAADITPDGLTMIGTGHHPDFGNDLLTWRAALPEPAGSALLTSVFAMSVLARRRSAPTVTQRRSL
jgi:hypothetical protein